MLEGQWVDHNIIRALGQELGVNIAILQDNVGLPLIVIGNFPIEDTIIIGHIAEAHYVNTELMEGENHANHYTVLQNLIQQQLYINQQEAEQLHNEAHPIEVIVPEIIHVEEINTNRSSSQEIYSITLPLGGCESSLSNSFGA